MRYCFFLVSLFFIFRTHAQVGEFNQPWQDTAKPIIIDTYYKNRIDWDLMLSDKRVTAVIHKASQGLKPDTLYLRRKEVARQQGILWGSYHLGQPGDPILQADYYLDITRCDTTELLALDLESVDSSKHMNLKNAELFINHVYDVTGRYPLVYCNKALLTEIAKKYDSTSVFAKCGLWYARFRNDIPDYTPVTWPTYTLWQFSSEINCKKRGQCLYNIPGIDYDMDINVYNGTADELRNKWPRLKQ